MEKVKEYLENFGLSDIEVQLYLGLLETGPTTVLEIAKHTGIKRTTAHVNIETLIEKGLVAQTKSGTRRKILAEDPEKLKFIIDQRALTLKNLEKSLPGILGTLQTQVKKSATGSELDVKYFEGKNGVQKVYQEAFQAKELRSYVNLAAVHKVFTQNAEIYKEVQKSNKGLIVKEIVDDSEETVKKAKDFEKNTNFEFRIAPFFRKLEAVDMLIFDGRVVVINYAENIVASVIENQDYYEFTKEVFDYLWGILPKAE